MDNVAAQILRLVIIFCCAVAMVVMMVGFIKYHSKWNQKTRDYWFGRMMWSLAGLSGSIEGMARDTPFRYALVFFIVASLVTLKGVLTKGAWGTPPKEVTKEKLDDKIIG